MLIPFQSNPAINEDGSAHNPIAIWNIPKQVALYFGGESSEANVLWTGSILALWRPYKTNNRIIPKNELIKINPIHMDANKTYEIISTVFLFNLSANFPNGRDIKEAVKVNIRYRIGMWAVLKPNCLAYTNKKE